MCGRICVYKNTPFDHHTKSNNAYLVDTLKKLFMEAVRKAEEHHNEAGVAVIARQLRKIIRYSFRHSVKEMKESQSWLIDARMLFRKRRAMWAFKLRVPVDDGKDSVPLCTDMQAEVARKVVWG